MNPLGLFLEPPGPLPTHLHAVTIAYSECLPTRLNILAERARFSQVHRGRADGGDVQQANHAKGPSHRPPAARPLRKPVTLDAGRALAVKVDAAEADARSRPWLSDDIVPGLHSF